MIESLLVQLLVGVLLALFNYWLSNRK
ncbi:type I toxin-antitoxin system Fst family toxin [Lapidilactobacillus wuchangensis]